MIPLLTISYLLSAFFVLIYSYGFVDFNLTLSSNPVFLNFLAPLQRLVYFERPLSGQTYAIIMSLMFVSYLLSLLVISRRNSPVFSWRPVLILLAILTLAYPMLSYDVFNYMFHAKIVWFYQSNPHLHTPLEFSGDLWLRFMRWVHTTSAYGPVFTLIESPSYLLGFGKFVPVLYLMKLSMTAFFVWCIYLVGRLGSLIGLSRQRTVLSQYLLALNPFLLMDVVVNGHNDAVMMALFLLSLYYCLRTKIGKSLLSLLASIGTKYMTILTIPTYFIKSPKLKVLFSSLILLLPVLISPGRFQPWYLVWAIIPAVLIDHLAVTTWIVVASFSGLVYYYPYISTGFWVNSLSFVSYIVYLPIFITALLYFPLKIWASRGQRT